uniref:Cholesterol 24-hydroxylase n=1 Tax=Latimeria chalumnae TaxID=7897 RepID=H3B7K5_LATCH
HALFKMMGSTLLWLLSLLCLAFLIYCGYVKYIHMKFDHIPGPPRDSFLFGHIPAIHRVRENGLVHDLFHDWAEKYGPVCRLNFLHQVYLLVTSPEAIKEYMMSPKYPKDPYTYNLLFSLFGTRFFGQGLLTDSDHEHWYHQRRIFDPAFSKFYLKGMMGVFNEKSERLMEKLNEKANGRSVVSMHSMVNCITLEIITKVAFGLKLNLFEDKQETFINAISTCLQGMEHYLRNPYMQYMPWHRKFVAKVRESAEFLRQTGQECIKKRKKMMQDEEEVPEDILYQILKSAEQEGNYDEELMLDNFVTLHLTGQETTANQLAFVIMELTSQPEITKKMRDEVDEVIGSKQDISFEDLGKLQYLSQVLKESLRLYPPGPGTSRWVPEDAVIEGIKIPGKVSIIFNSYAMGRMDKFFKDPLTFDPDRFHPDAPKPYYCYFPFALGPRSCLGQVFSQMEAKVIMAKILQRFEFNLVPGQSYRILDLGTLRPRDGVECTLKSRNAAANRSTT